MTTTVWRCSSSALRILAWSWLVSSCLPLSAEDAPVHSVKRIGSDPQTGISQAVIVENAALAYTAQFLPVTPTGEIAGVDVDRQASTVLDHLSSVLKSFQSDLSQVVKLNVYVTNADITPVVRSVIARRFASGLKPAVSFVQTRLPHPDALVAMDAVGAFESKRSAFSRIRGSQLPIRAPFAQAAALENAPRVYISGQAEKGLSLAAATAKTLASLKTTLDHLGLSKDHVVQVKCFLTPMSDVRSAETAIADFFGPATPRDAVQVAPPCVFVEWESSLPIEIEFIVGVLPHATAPNDSTSPREPLEFITPPGMTASPVFCRVVRVNDPRTIFISGLFAKDATDGTGQVTQVFEQLQEILKASGSDLRHLAKATYYVSDNDTSAKLNELRPKFYDPQRPPAASKAQVFGVGLAGRSLTLDMIAVPAK